MIDRKFQFLDAETSARELIIETLVNFLYGFNNILIYQNKNRRIYQHFYYLLCFITKNIL